MAELKNSKPKTEKTSASVSSTLPRISPTKLDIKHISCNIPKLKSWSLGSRLVSNEKEKHIGPREHSHTIIHKSKLLNFNNSDQGFTNNISLIYISPRNYRGQIPIHQKHSLYLPEMSPPMARSPSPIKKNSPKEMKASNKIKTITFDQNGRKENKTGNSKSPSPVRTPGSYKKTKPGTSSPKNSDKMTIMNRLDKTKQVPSPRTNSPAKRKPKVKVLSSSNFEFISKEKKGNEAQRLNGGSDATLVKQTSQPSMFNKEKLLQPQEKISLDHIKNKVYSGDHRRLSFEKVQLCIEKSTESSSLAKRSYMVTYSAEDIQNKEEISLSFLQNLSCTNITSFSKDSGKNLSSGVTDSKAVIRTPSGGELVLTPSMNLDIEKEANGCDDIKISELLKGTSENFEEQKDIHLFQDDANEYDSEESTDGEISGKGNSKLSLTTRMSGSKCSNLHRKSTNSLRRSREAELLNDVYYRQSVYHPAVSRRQNDEDTNTEFGSKSKSIEDNLGFVSNSTEGIVRNRSPILQNKYSLQSFSTEKSDRNTNERSGNSNFDKTNDKPIYNSVIEDDSLYGTLRGMKRIRTKKERISGALLHFTLKIMRLLALFNLWPGDNCYMLTSQSLRLAR